MPGASRQEEAPHTSFPISPSGSESEEDGVARPRALRLRFFIGSSSSSSSPLLPPRSARSLRRSFSSLSCSRSRRSSSSCSRRLLASSSRLRSSSRRFHSLMRSTSPLSLSLGWKVHQQGPQHTLQPPHHQQIPTCHCWTWKVAVLALVSALGAWGVASQLRKMRGDLLSMASQGCIEAGSGLTWLSASRGFFDRYI